MDALRQVDDWPAQNVAVTVPGAEGELARRGPEEHVFRWASVTKPVTALAALVAAEEGTIDLDEPAGPPGSTMRHLLAHASGLPFEAGPPIGKPGARRIYSNAGFEVLAGPLFQTPDEAADMAIAAKVHVLGVSSLAAGHKTLMPQLVEALKDRNAEHIIVVCGGVVPRQDYEFLFQHGVAAVFGPGTNVIEAASTVLDLMEGKRRNT